MFVVFVVVAVVRDWRFVDGCNRCWPWCLQVLFAAVAFDGSWTVDDDNNHYRCLEKVV